MKRCLISIPIFTMLLVGCATQQSGIVSKSANGDSNSLMAPASNHALGGEFSPPLPTSTNGISVQKFTSGIIWDFRDIFRPWLETRDLKNRHLCSIMFCGEASSLRSIPVGDGLTLNKVIRLYLKQSYDGQVRVVSQNKIVQTAADIYDPSEQERIQVSPGDLVFIGGRQ